jgi:nuclear transport factor 2 (NTF2) superfamily protein
MVGRSSRSDEHQGQDVLKCGSSRRVDSRTDLFQESERKFRWAFGPRPDDHPDLSDLSL